MKIISLEFTDMGNNKQEIADKCLEYIQYREFATEEEFYIIEYDLITRACAELGWLSIPQTGGLIATWDK